MKTVLVLLFIFGAAFAAPAEDQKKAPEAPVVKEEEAAAPAPVLAEAGGPESRQMCPNGWENYRQRCYLFVPSAMNWQDAESHCRGFDAHLAPVTSSGEYNYLQRLTRIAGQSVAWLGGFRLQNSKWMWTANKGFYYTNWSPSSSSSNSSCMFLHSTDGWGSTHCDTSYNFICSKNLYGC